MDFSRMPSVKEIECFEARGPWTTKAKGKLTVLMAVPLTTIQSHFLSYDESELAKIPQDIRGLRIYSVRHIPKNEIAGGEFHYIRKEYFFGLSGKFLMTCVDLYGRSRNFIITPEFGIFIPNFIRHSLVAREDESSFIVLANTLFIPEDPRTHDTYKAEEFESLKKQMENYQNGQKHSK